MSEATRIGILGGTFDPPHIGHLRAAIEAREALALHRVLLVVANDPWQKSGSRSVTPAEIRLEMVRAAVEGVEHVEASDIEIRRGGPSYTVETLRTLHGHGHGLEHGAGLVVLVGADVVGGLDTWHEATELPGLAELAVFDRSLDGSHAGSIIPPEAVAVVAPGVEWEVRSVPLPLLYVSSSDIRRRVRDGRSIDFLVPASVAVIIERRGIYREGS